ncbi:MAG: hypothetical protein WC740_01380 [Verrucomicrobiia bacterium]
MKQLAGWKSWLLTLAAALLPLDVPASPTGEQPAGMIASGTPSATPYYVRDSGVTGPTVVITGGVHGNEPAGRVCRRPDSPLAHHARQAHHRAARQRRRAES